MDKAVRKIKRDIIGYTKERSRSDLGWTVPK